MQEYTVILSPDPDIGGYAVVVPAMPGALTQGESLQKALSNAAAVMALWLEVAAERGERPLDETPHVIAAEVESVLADRDEAGWDRHVELVSVQPVHPITAA
ncbi:MAG: type II toxin-antitoxin system HicB family antitoxin [Dehalococcoidia bacterium]